MSGKDEIKELFQRELGNYEEKVDPGLWQGIQSGISAGSSAAATTLSVGAKVVIGIASVAAITVASLVIYNSNSDESDIKSEQENIAETVQVNDVTNKEEKEAAEIQDNNLEISNETEVEKDIKTEKKEDVSTQSNNEEIYSLDNSSNNQPLIKEESTEEVQSNSTKEEAVKTDEIPKETKEVEETKKEVIELKLEPIISLQKNQRVEFDCVMENIDEIVWNFGDGAFSTREKPEHFYDEPGTYNITVTGRNEDKEISKKLSVVIEIDGEILSLPNSFTPNGDGRNDHLFVETKGIKEFQVTIMNNKQEVVYKSNDSAFRWDGTAQNGQPVPEGNYVYIIIAKDNKGNTLNKYQQLYIRR